MVYYRASEATDINTLLMNEIQEVWIRYPFMGYRSITRQLKALGYSVNRKRVRRLMMLMGIKAIYPKPNTSIKNKQHETYPYLLKDLAITACNQTWQVDITYLKHKGSFMYLTALIDVHSRYVVGWALSSTLHTDGCLDALTHALNTATPDIVNSDQGCQFTSDDWIKALKERDIKISMTGKGRCHDNIFIERFWRTLKYEEIYLNEYDSVADLKSAIKSYIEFYNHKRFHQSLDYKTPAEVYFGGLQEPVDMMDNANALSTYPQAQQQLNNKLEGGRSLN
jgi:putative transposase